MAGSRADPTRAGPAAPCYSLLIGWLFIGGSGEDAAAGGSTMEMRMHIIQFFFGRTCEYWLQMLLCKRSQDS
uniref:Uncharacterized protein n=2 Tax=Setaria italica TaxID=4555 RepID=K4AHL7_SETIT